MHKSLICKTFINILIEKVRSGKYTTHNLLVKLVSHNSVKICTDSVKVSFVKSLNPKNALGPI
ncbi:hypothetical protein QIA36_04915 (plasmid) [Borreliella yangtzensis]